MMKPSIQRSTTTRVRHRTQIARDKPPCGICELEIDYTLPHLDPWEYVVDHIVPLNKGGTDTLDNKQAAHRVCNRRKSDKMPDELGATVRLFVTTRSW